MGVYSKAIAEGSFEHRFYEALGFPPVSDEGGAPLVLRITLGDMELLDGFYMSLPSNVASVSIEDVIRKYVLCENESDRNAVKQKLARDPNPDLMEIYDSLLWLYQQAESGDVTLNYYINNGASDIPPTDPVSAHQQTCTTNDGDSYNLLDLVLEVYDNVDPFSGMTDEQRDMMLMDFRSVFILYLMDRYGYQPEDQDSDVAACLSPILDYLASENTELLHLEEKYFITPKGHELLNNIIDEAEFYIDNYDIFGDVSIVRGGEISFNTGYGENLIVPVFVREGIEPRRVLFIAALYLGNLDHLISDLTMLFSEEPFRQLFSLIHNSPSAENVGTELLDRIISAGKSKIKEQQLREERLKHIQNIERRIEDEDSDEL